MNIIICLDKNNGISFNNRRQSRDREVVYDILKNCSNNKLWMNSYSKELFDESIQLIENDEERQTLIKMLQLNVNIDEECLDKADITDYCFVENDMINNYMDKINEIYVYRWDKVYPQDERFDIEGYRINNIKEIKGYSHDIITREIYEKE